MILFMFLFFFLSTCYSFTCLFIHLSMVIWLCVMCWPLLCCMLIGYFRNEVIWWNLLGIYLLPWTVNSEAEKGFCMDHLGLPIITDGLSANLGSSQTCISPSFAKTGWYCDLCHTPSFYKYLPKKVLEIQFNDLCLPGLEAIHGINFSISFFFFFLLFFSVSKFAPKNKKSITLPFHFLLPWPDFTVMVIRKIIQKKIFICWHSALYGCSESEHGYSHYALCHHFQAIKRSFLFFSVLALCFVVGSIKRSFLFFSVLALCFVVSSTLLYKVRGIYWNHHVCLSVSSFVQKISSQPYVTKPGMVMHHQGVECHERKIGYSEGLYTIKILLFTIASELMLLLLSNLVWWQIIISQSVQWIYWISVRCQCRSKCSKFWIHVCPMIFSEPLNLL